MFNKPKAILFISLLIVPCFLYAAVDKRVNKRVKWSIKYDHYFKKYAKYYFGPNFDWHWFKAQAIAESNLQPAAKSEMGARGLMQILPSTFKDIRKKNKQFSNIEEPRWNIAAGIYYDRQMYRRWYRNIPSKEKLLFTFASYNAGFGNIRKAYRRADKKHDKEAEKNITEWKLVEPFAPNETKHYVKRIQIFKKSVSGHLF